MVEQRMLGPWAGVEMRITGVARPLRARLAVRRCTAERSRRAASRASIVEPLTFRPLTKRQRPARSWDERRSNVAGTAGAVSRVRAVAWRLLFLRGAARRRG